MTTMIDIAASHRERIGCSQIAPALGLSQYGTRYQLWQQYTGRAERPDISGYLRVKIGEPMEPVLMPLAAERLGRALRRDRGVEPATIVLARLAGTTGTGCGPSR